MKKGTEDLTRETEILLDSGTQKCLRALVRLRELKRRSSGGEDMQSTLTHSKDYYKEDGVKGRSKKKWKMLLPKTKKEVEFDLPALCFFCDKVFNKRIYCEDCGLYKCPSCGKCGCNLDKFALECVRKTILTLTAQVCPIEDNMSWRANCPSKEPHIQECFPHKKPKGCPKK